MNYYIDLYNTKVIVISKQTNKQTNNKTIELFGQTTAITHTPEEAEEEAEQTLVAKDIAVIKEILEMTLQLLNHDLKENTRQALMQAYFTKYSHQATQLKKPHRSDSPMRR